MPGFDFTAAVRCVCEDMTGRVAELSHIDMHRVAVGFCQARKRAPHGLQASLTPLRFEGGAKAKRVRGRWFTTQKLVDGSGRDYLYLLQFYLPRFLDHPLEEKLTTITHELWHIGPAMDGDLRRHAGRCYAHGASQRAFDEHAAWLGRQWLKRDPPAGLYEWLTLDFGALAAEHGGVRGQRFPAPKLAPVDAARRG
ncbi:MAG: hypothetical protein AAF790_09640 [Planctomycetota bacterium]